MITLGLEKADTLILWLSAFAFVIGLWVYFPSMFPDMGDTALRTFQGSLFILIMYTFVKWFNIVRESAGW